MRPELLVLAGLHAAGVEAVIGRIRTLDPDVAVLHHGLRDIADGVVHRRLRRGDIDATTTLQLAHGCISCTLREDLLPTLRALAAPGGPARIVLHLDPALEPEHICWALLHVLLDGSPVTADVELRGVVTCIDTGSWLDDATSDDVLAERGIADPGRDVDERTVAQVVVGQVEFADLIVTTGAADAWASARTAAVLARIAPAAARLPIALLDRQVFLRRLPVGARRGRPDDVHGPLLRGQPPLDADCGVRTVLFTARRPFHPERLHRAIDVLLDGVVRTRGRIWLATRPDAVLWLESAGGGLRVGHAGDWLADAGDDAWEHASADRRAMAALNWDPRFGDRGQDIVAVAHDADPEEIERTLRDALLTDTELAAGEQSWAALPDPFGWWHTDPCGEPAAPATRSAGTGTEEH